MVAVPSFVGFLGLVRQTELWRTSEKAREIEVRELLLGLTRICRTDLACFKSCLNSLLSKKRVDHPFNQFLVLVIESFDLIDQADFTLIS